MQRLHYSGEPVADAAFTDIQTLNNFSDQQFAALTEILFRFVTEPTESERLLNELCEFASQNGMILGPLKNIVKSALLVPNGALKRNLTAEHVKADFIALGLSEEKAGYFADQWKLHSAALSRAHGIAGSVLMWIENWLADRKQRVGVNGFFYLWNSLSQKVVEASSLAIFKRELDVAFVAKGIRGYGEKAGTGY
ncbi:COMM domain-containing protein 7-like [Leucoraja erinacea]|uniref:COMM domain-containing protein 7-like n=1 Tax=Leucoraja erinaceus TaxID=7782 RepID=UPI00245433CD|nr:COMM domain-containing protein 7-like [Leucoraja erinacea]